MTGIPKKALFGKEVRSLMKPPQPVEKLYCRAL
jgi:hypothetical protein